MKIKFKVIAIGEDFQLHGTTYRKQALSLAVDDDRVGHLILADTEVEADEAVKTMADRPVLKPLPQRRWRRAHVPPLD